ncbi:MAG: hypothetical protein LBR20_08030 [Propionibacteriaceae bacterium]|jgi:hypothetical protein|nr:hypothetical protein [Propionibacteriaceae bacterium]
MKKTWIAVVAVVLAVSGCAIAEPVESESPAPVVSDSAGVTVAANDPATAPGTETTAPAADFLIATGSTSAEQALAGVACAAVVRAGTTCATTPAPTSSYDLVADLSTQEYQLAVVFSTSTVLGLNDGSEPPAPGDALAQLAELVSPDVAVMDVSQLDGKIVWAASPATRFTWSNAENLEGIGLVPSWLHNRIDGVPSLESVYGIKAITWQDEDSPLLRAERLNNEEAVIGAFRNLDYYELEGLSVVEDPSEITLPDQVAILIPAALQDSSPIQIAAVQDAFAALTDETLAPLESAVATGSDPITTAQTWLDSVR